MRSLGVREGVFILVATLLGTTQGSFMMVIPQEFHPGWPFSVSTTVHKTDSPVLVQVTLREHGNTVNVLGTTTETFTAGETRMMIFPVDSDLDLDANYEVSVKCTGGINREDVREIGLNRNSTLVLVQTDKQIYKPDQLVRIRAATLDVSMVPLKTSINITIIDPNENKVERFTDMKSIMGVSETDFKLSKYAMLGQWKIFVEGDHGQSYTHYFTVDEYVLPKFSVNLKVDQQYLVKSRSSLPDPSVEVTATYTYGEGVQGKCELTISVDGSREVGRYSAQLSAAGTASFSDINWEEVRGQARILPGTLTLVAKVTDVTGRTESDETEISVQQHNIMMRILDSSTTVLRNNLPATVKLSVTDLENKPVSGTEIEVKVTVGRDSQVLKDVLEEGQKEVTLTYTPSWDSEQTRELSVALEAKVVNFPEVKVQKDIWMYMSGDISAAVQLRQNNEKSTSGKLVYDILHSDKPSTSSTMSYVVINKGNVVEAGPTTGSSIEIFPTVEMCPDSNLLVYWIVGDAKAEVVMDMVTISPPVCYSKEVSVSFNTVEARVGSEVDMEVSVKRVDGAPPGIHEVFYLGVDKSVILLQGQMDIGEEELVNSMRQLNVGSLAKRLPRGAADNWQPHSAGGYLMSSGVTELMTPDLCVHLPTPVSHARAYASIESLVILPYADMDDADRNRADNKVVASNPTKPVLGKTIRTNFPDTWLWGHKETNMAGQLSMPSTLPDTITSWVVSAYAVSEDGLAVAKAPAEIRAFQTFFLSMNLPYSIKRGEAFVLRCTVFNYRNQKLQTIVSLKDQPGQFKVLEKSVANGGLFVEDLELEANLASSVEFKIQATTIGKITLEVAAEDNVDGQRDQVVRQLLVKPEGVERSRSICRVLDLSSSSEPLISTFDLDWPDNVVPDSKRVEVKVTGDVFGQALSNLDSLVMQPVGCGEQNMITTVPNIMGLSYIELTGQLGMDELAQKLRDFAKYGYQRELNYRHRDGSFSAWGERSTGIHPKTEGNPGSTWLTAFVMKSFSLASKFIQVDADILSQGIRFLKGKQLTSGEFIESGNLFHSEMTSGTNSGPALTVYCLISMLETADALGNDVYDLNQSIQRATSFIKAQTDVARLKDNKKKFMAAMTAYALSLLPNPDSETIALRDSLLEAVLEMGAPWKDDTTEVKVNAKVAAGREMSYHTHPPSHDLEIGAYVLLTYLRTEKFMQGLTVMKWLQSQQNSKGGYRSTQDTVMVLQALSRYGAQFKDKSSSAKVTVTDPSGNSTLIDISGDKATLLHTYYMSSTPNTVTVKMEGQKDSLAVVKVVYIYYTEAGKDDLAPPTKSYTLTTSSQRTSARTHQVTACVKRLGTLEDEGMTVTTLTLPSGEKSMDDVATMMVANPEASRIEVEEETESIHFYTSGPPSTTGNCFKANIESEVVILDRKPGSIKTYSYYSPENMEEIALDLKVCTENCGGGTDGGVTLHHMATNLVLTVFICTLATLIFCV